ncbi:hypothetical protein LOTGIDRAFT_107438, partial [Lottia gigantea]
NENEVLPRPEEERITEAEKNKRLQKQLEELKADLADAKEPEKMTKNDELHQENVRQGRDKYKTLKNICKGDVQRRIDEFRSM